MKVPKGVQRAFVQGKAASSPTGTAKGTINSSDLQALEAALDQLREELEGPGALAHAPKRLEEAAHFYELNGERAARAVIHIVLNAALGEREEQAA